MNRTNAKKTIINQCLKWKQIACSNLLCQDKQLRKSLSQL